MRKRSVLTGSTIILTIILLATLLFGNSWLAGSGALDARAASRSGTQAIAQRRVTASDLQALFFVWASGTPAVQRAAAQDCASLALSAKQCAQVSAATRAAWLDMATHDPSALGRPKARPNLAGRAQALARLTASLTNATNDHVAPLLAATRTTLAQISQPSWIGPNILCCYGIPNRPLTPPGTVLVWGTSFTQNPLPGGLDPTLSPYAALPDAYLKYANWGQISNIPSIYQSYYAPTGTTAHWSVKIFDPRGTGAIANVPITDVGPWNEDDNWWDPNGTSTTLPASCPVASPPAFADATSNALVDGVCPTCSAGGTCAVPTTTCCTSITGCHSFKARATSPVARSPMEAPGRPLWRNTVPRLPQPPRTQTAGPATVGRRATTARMAAGYAMGRTTAASPTSPALT